MANALNVSLEGQVVVLRADVFSPPYRALHHRVWRVTGGFGASPAANGRALFCQSLFDGEKTRFDGTAVERVATTADLAVVAAAQKASTP